MSSVVRVPSGAISGAGEGPAVWAGRAGDLSDLLLLGSLAMKVPALCIGIQDGGAWQCMEFGDTAGMAAMAPAVFDAIAAGDGATELVDLPERARVSPGAQWAMMRWAYGVKLETPGRSERAVVVAFDRVLRQATVQDRDALRHMARRLGDVLWSPAPVDRAGLPGDGVSGDGVSGDGVSGDGDVAVLAAAVPTSRNGASRRRAPSLERDLNQPRLLKSAEVASLFNVTDRTIANWAASGRLPSLRTVGGQLRFRSEDVMAALGTGPYVALRAVADYGLPPGWTSPGR